MGLQDKFQYFTWKQTIILIIGILIFVGLLSWNFWINYNSLQEQSQILNNILESVQNISRTVEVRNR